MSRGAVGVRVEQAAGEAEPRDGKDQGRGRGREAGVEASPRQWRRRRAQGIRLSERSLAKVLRQTEELETEADPSPGPSAKYRQADTDTPADLEALLPHGALLGQRAARQWRPALQSIAEGGG